MGTIVSSGIGSGLDVQGLVQKLVAAEGQPQSVRLDTQEAKIQSKLSALGSVRSALAGFQSAVNALKSETSLRTRSVALSSPDYVSAFATPDAAPGIYEVEVERLASSHQLASDPVASADTAVGTGTLTVTLGASSFSITLDETTGTLAGIRDAINSAGDNVGVKATIVSGVDGARLLLTGDVTGAANAIVVTQAGGDGGLEALVYDPANSTAHMAELRAAADARVLIGGFAAESPTNTISEAVSGLELTLLTENSPGESTLVSVELDRSGAAKTVKSLVDAYNSLMDTIASATSYDAEARQGGPLLGDAGVRNLGYQLRRELNSLFTGPGSSFQTLSEIGITTDVNGKLSFDSAKLDTALLQDSEGVRTLFADGDAGVATRLAALLDPYLEAGGVLDSRNDGLKSSLDDINSRREALNERLAMVEQRYLKQFNALDSLLAELQSTSSYLQQQLASLPGFNAINGSG